VSHRLLSTTIEQISWGQERKRWASPVQDHITITLFSVSVAETNRQGVLAAQSSIPVVLYGILGAPRDLLGDVGPSIAQLLVHLD